MNQAYSRLSTTHGHITDCKLDSVVYAGVIYSTNDILLSTLYYRNDYYKDVYSILCHCPHTHSLPVPRLALYRGQHCDVIPVHRVDPRGPDEHPTVLLTAGGVICGQ